jgi:flagellar hook-basal body complex protein FliE
MISAISAVRSIGAADATAGASAAGAAAGADFSQVLADVAGGTVDALRAGEAAAISGIGGTSSVQGVVAAVMSAEQALQTAIAVRDKLVAAYQEVSRMAI